MMALELYPENLPPVFKATYSTALLFQVKLASWLDRVAEIHDFFQTPFLA